MNKRICEKGETHYAVLVALIVLTALFLTQAYVVFSKEGLNQTAWDAKQYHDAYYGGKNQSLCQRIYNTSLRNYCLVIVGHANASLCPLIEDTPLRDTCLNMHALSAKNTTLCRQISDEALEGACMVKLTRDLTTCENMTDVRARDNCYYQYYVFIDINAGDASVCSSIWGSQLNKRCTQYLANRPARSKDRFTVT